MSKKINPKDQTREKNKAFFEFLKRNKTEYATFLEKYEFESVEALCERYNAPREEVEGWLAESLSSPAVMDESPCFPAYLKAYNRTEKKDRNGPCKPAEVIKDMEKFGEIYLEELVKDSENIIRQYMEDRPLERLLVSIDLTRSTEVILAEVQKLVASSKREIETRRLKWLPIFNDLLAIWDLWEKHSQRRCFKLIAKQLKIPESTVKARWRLAYKLIYGHDYTKQKGHVESDKLCSSCKDQKKCYRIINNSMQFIPCAAYLKLAAPDYMRENTFGDIDEIKPDKNNTYDFNDLD